MTFTEAQAALEAIRNLPIERLNERQPMLVALAAAIVNTLHGLHHLANHAAALGGNVLRRGGERSRLLGVISVVLHGGA